MRIFALDISTKCTGWALAESNREDPKEQILESGSIKGLKSTKKEPISKEGRIEYFRDSLNLILSRIDNFYPKLYIEKFVIERSFVRGSGDTTRFLSEQQGVIKNEIYRTSSRGGMSEIIEIPPSEWRFHFLGFGNGKKEETINIVKALGYNVNSEDEAEAIGIALGYILKVTKENK